MNRTCPGEADGDGRPLPWLFALAGIRFAITLSPGRPSFAIMSSVIETIERAQLRRVPSFAAGDRVKVHFQVIEGSRRRVQVFEGVVIKRQGHGARETFTVRKQSFGVGVERSFPVHSPKIERIELAARGDVRRAKLYYLRDRVGKRARVRERRYTGPEESGRAGPPARGDRGDRRRRHDRAGDDRRGRRSDAAADSAPAAEGSRWDALPRRPRSRAPAMAMRPPSRDAAAPPEAAATEDAPAPDSEGAAASSDAAGAEGGAPAGDEPA